MNYTSEIPFERIQCHLLEQRQKLVETLSALVLLESPSTVPESQQQILRLIQERLERIEFAVRIVEGNNSGGMLLAEPTEDHFSARQLLVGHCDTVWPLGTLEKMPLEVSENRVAGPGTFDMKAGLTQMLFALETIRALDLRPSVAPCILVNSDEELGSGDSEENIVDWARRSDRAFILEPALGPAGRLKTARKGIGEFTVTLEGKAAHAGLDHESGASAILELSYLIQNLHELNDVDRGITVNVGLVDGGVRPNVVAPESKAVVDVRIEKAEDAESVEELIHGLRAETPGVSLHIEGSVTRGPLEKTPRNQDLWELAQRTGRQMGLDLEEGSAGGASDGNITSQHTATLDGLGAVGDGAHAFHEFVYIDKMVERTILLTHLLLSPPIGG